LLLERRCRVSVAGKLAILKHSKCCAGKIRHLSMGAAEAHLRALARVDPQPMNVYRCLFCKRWHVGHTWYPKA